MMLSLLLSSALAGEWDFRHQLGASGFPLGLRYAFRSDYHLPLWNSDSVLFEDTYFAPGVYADVTPAYFHVGPRVRFAPIAVFDLQADFVYGYYFGSFSGITDFNAASDIYSDEALDAAAEEGRRRSGGVLKSTISPTLQARVGKLIIALPQEFVWIHVKQPEGAGDFWYEPQYDTLIKWDDWIMTNSAVMFWSFKDDTEEDKRFVWAGANFSHQLAFGTGDRTMKLGPIVVFKPGQSMFVPTMALFSQAYLVSRTHPVVPPYIAGALIWSN